MEPPVDIRWIVIACLAVMIAATGCDRESPEPVSEKTVQEKIEESDDFTRSDEWPQDPQRIVSLAPNITEILFELGLGDRVVGVTRYCDWPPQATDIPKIGGMLDPDYEAILATRPEVVLGVKDGADHQVVERLESAGVAFGFLAMDDLATIQRGFHLLGIWLGAEERADELKEDFDRALRAESRSVRETLDLDGATALVVYDHEPVVAAGVGSFGHEILILAGLQNALGDDLGSYPVLDMEKVMSLNPAVIIDVSIGPTTEEVAQFWERFDSLDAVQTGRVVHVDDPVMMRPGPRIPEALRRLGEAVEGL